MIGVERLYAIGSMSLPPVKPYYCSVEFNQDPRHASAAERQGAGPRDDEPSKQHVKISDNACCFFLYHFGVSPPFLTDDLSRKALRHLVNVVAARETILLLGRVQSGPAPCVRRRTPRRGDPGTMNPQNSMD